MNWWLSGMQGIITEFGFVCEMFTAVVASSYEKVLRFSNRVADPVSTNRKEVK